MSLVGSIWVVSIGSAAFLFHLVALVGEFIIRSLNGPIPGLPGHSLEVASLHFYIELGISGSRQRVVEVLCRLLAVAIAGVSPFNVQFSTQLISH